MIYAFYIQVQQHRKLQTILYQRYKINILINAAVINFQITLIEVSKVYIILLKRRIQLILLIYL